MIPRINNGVLSLTSLPAMDSAEPKHNENVAKRFMKAAALCMSCCLSSHNIILRASVNTSPLSLQQTQNRIFDHTEIKQESTNKNCKKKYKIYGQIIIVRKGFELQDEEESVQIQNML